MGTLESEGWPTLDIKSTNKPAKENMNCQKRQLSAPESKRIQSMPGERYWSLPSSTPPSVT